MPLSAATCMARNVAWSMRVSLAVLNATMLFGSAYVQVQVRPLSPTVCELTVKAIAEPTSAMVSKEHGSPNVEPAGGAPAESDAKPFSQAVTKTAQTATATMARFKCTFRASVTAPRPRRRQLRRGGRPALDDARPSRSRGEGARAGRAPRFGPSGG